MGVAMLQVTLAAGEDTQDSGNEVRTRMVCARLSYS